MPTLTTVDIADDGTREHVRVAEECVRTEVVAEEGFGVSEGPDRGAELSLAGQNMIRIHQ